MFRGIGEAVDPGAGDAAFRELLGGRVEGALAGREVLPLGPRRRALDRHENGNIRYRFVLDLSGLGRPVS